MSDEKQTETTTEPTAGTPAFIDARRRGFLQGAVLAGGAAAGGSALAGGDELPADPIEGVAAVETGYRETDHVRAYYAAARS